MHCLHLPDVQHNAQTIQKQLEMAEKKLSAALALLIPSLAEEEDLPFTDIYEELDEDGNVICEQLPSHLTPSSDLVIQ